MKRPSTVESVSDPAVSQDPDTETRTNTQRRYEITRDQLPISCPTPDMTLWNSHPRVYLPLHAQPRARCPYCSAEFVLID